MRHHVPLSGFVLLQLLLAPFAVAQHKDKWRRVYTLEDSVIDMNASSVTYGLEDIGRVRFRTTLSKPVPVRGAQGIKYKYVIETMEFRCPQKRYRISDATLFDNEHNQVRSDEAPLPAEWKTIKPGSMMERLFRPGCELIAKKRRNP